MFNLLAHADHNSALDVLFDAIIDSLKILPLLLIIHILMAVIDKYAGKKTYSLLKGPVSPLIGAVAGSLPQCGFSVAATRLYTKKYIPIGALIAVYVATSDEAIVVLIGSSDGIKKLLPLLGIKFVLALIAGYLVNFIFSLIQKRKAKNAEINSNNEHLDEEKIMHHAHNHSCGCGCHGSENKLQTYLIHPLIHTLKIFAFILIVNIILSYIIFGVTEHRLEQFMMGIGYLQPALTALVGLIPNCAASVVIAKMYGDNLLTIGSAIAGLSVGAGLGYMVLIKENKNKLSTLLILLGMYVFGTIFGIIIDFIVSLF